MTVENLTDADLERLAGLLADRSQSPQVAKVGDHRGHWDAIQQTIRERCRVHHVTGELRQRFVLEEWAAVHAERKARYQANAPARETAIAELAQLEQDLVEAAQRVEQLQDAIAERERIVEMHVETPRWQDQISGVVMERADRRFRRLAPAPIMSPAFADAVLELARSTGDLPKGDLRRQDVSDRWDERLTDVMRRGLSSRPEVMV